MHKDLGLIPALHKPGQKTEAGGSHISDQAGIASKTVLKENKHQVKNQEFVQMVSECQMLHGLDQVSK